jgi:hypothetical protein
MSNKMQYNGDRSVDAFNKSYIITKSKRKILRTSFPTKTITKTLNTVDRNDSPLYHKYVINGICNRLVELYMDFVAQRLEDI